MQSTQGECPSPTSNLGNRQGSCCSQRGSAGKREAEKGGNAHSLFHVALPQIASFGKGNVGGLLMDSVVFGSDVKRTSVRHDRAGREEVGGGEKRNINRR